MPLLSARPPVTLNPQLITVKCQIIPFADKAVLTICPELPDSGNTADGWPLNPQTLDRESDDLATLFDRCNKRLYVFFIQVTFFTFFNVF